MDETTQADVESQAVETQAVATDTPQIETISLDEAKKMRQEHASLRRRLKAYEEAEAAKQAASLSETEKTAKELQALREATAKAESDRQTLNLQLAIEREARKLNIADEDAAFRLLDAGAIEYDENGKPTNVKDVLKELVKARPWLAPETKAPAPSVTPTNPARKPATLTREALGKMSAKDVATLLESDADTVYAAMRGE